VFQFTNAFGQTFLETYGDDDVLLPIRVSLQAIDARVPINAVKGGLLAAGAVEESLWNSLRDRLMDPLSS
jgi:hypothetical protein